MISKKQFAFKTLISGPDWKEEAEMHWKACGNDCIVDIDHVYEDHKDGSPYI